ncbi:MAG: DUF4382 domain-containing protein [Nitrososphaerota archaeon]|nr:DUF4382 domain-containing protein [Nitrososphaerota archaeon]MDG6923385.1 DUF4382 domain-containing protein [Nitrososphaerota archaeon]
MNRRSTRYIVVAIIIVIVAAAGVALFYIATGSTGTLSLQVKDASSNVSNLYVTISNIELQGSGNSTTSFKTGSVTFDLLALVNVSKILGNDSVPAGNYTMIRFTITSAVATVSGVNESLTVPSGQIKVPTQFQISSSKTTTIVLEINPGQINISVSRNLRPVVTPYVNGPS